MSDAYTVWLYCTNCTQSQAVRLYKGDTVQAYLSGRPLCSYCGCEGLEQLR